MGIFFQEPGYSVAWRLNAVDQCSGRYEWFSLWSSTKPFGLGATEFISHVFPFVILLSLSTFKYPFSLMYDMTISPY
jgi:hypothetical protein